MSTQVHHDPWLPRLGSVTIAASVLAALAFAGLDAFVGLPGRGVGSTISAYVYTDGAWVFRSAVLLLALATVLLIVGVTRSGRVSWRSVPVALFALTVLGLLAVAIFPKTDWSVGDSLPGQLHRLGSVIAFLAPPLATISLTRHRDRPGRPHPAARGAFWTAVSSLGLIVGLVGLIALTISRSRAWWLAFPLGSVERTMIAAELVALVFLGVWLKRGPGIPVAAEDQPRG